MKKREATLKKTLFQYYSIIVAGIMLVSFLLFFFYYIWNAFHNTLKQQESLIESIENALALEIDKMSTVSLNVLYSQGIRQELDQLPASTTQLRMADPVYKAIASIIGPNSTVAQVNIHADKGISVGWGIYELFEHVSPESFPWYGDAVQSKGRRYLDAPTLRTDFVYHNPYLNERRFLSLYRVYYDDAFHPQGVVEVVQDCKTFFSYPDTVVAGSSNLQIWIVDDKGRVFYPYYENTVEYEALQKKLDSFLYSRGQQPVTGYNRDMELVSFSSMGNTGWQIAIIQDASSSLSFLLYFSLAYVLITILFIVLAILLCYSISGKVLTPLHQLQSNIQSMNLNTMLFSKGELTPVDTDMLEIKTFDSAFLNMYQKLERSTKALHMAKDEEFRAKMRTMQSMLNPHFLYNNLANISVMAEEKMNEDIVALSENLCDYLRYVSMDSTLAVELRSEMLYTEKYIQCMRVRYGNRLQCEYRIPEEMGALPVPKLCLQPVIENSFKYAFNNDPPWKIEITGEQNETCWAIHVADNGIGIAQDEIEGLHALFRQVGETKDISNIKIGGMGLVNVYLRLVLTYGQEAGVTICNSKGGGVTVTLYGPNALPA